MMDPHWFLGGECGGIGMKEKESSELLDEMRQTNYLHESWR